MSCFLPGTQNSHHTILFLDSVPTTPSSVECPHTPTHMWTATHTHTHEMSPTHTHVECPPHTHVEWPTRIHMWNGPNIQTLLPTNFMFFSVLTFFSHLLFAHLFEQALSLISTLHMLVSVEPYTSMWATHQRPPLKKTAPRSHRCKQVL